MPSPGEIVSVSPCLSSPGTSPWGGPHAGEPAASYLGAWCSQRPASTRVCKRCWNLNCKHWMKGFSYPFSFPKWMLRFYSLLLSLDDVSIPLSTPCPLLIFLPLPGHTSAKPPCVFSCFLPRFCITGVPVTCPGSPLSHLNSAQLLVVPI